MHKLSPEIYKEISDSFHGRTVFEKHDIFSSVEVITVVRCSTQSCIIIFIPFQKDDYIYIVCFYEKSQINLYY